MNLYVIRHGQSEADLLNVLEGRADYELTEEGKNQAQLMAAWVAENFYITKVFASPLKRTAQTAQYLSQQTGISVQFEDDLMEWQNGLLAGLSREEAKIKYPAPPVKYPHTAMYGCESMINFRARAENILSKIINENQSEDSIAIVTHGGMINMLFRSFLQLPSNDTVFLSTGDTGIHKWNIENNNRRIVFANSLVHLNCIR